MFRQGCTCPALLFVTHTSQPFAYRAITFFGRTFQSVLLGFDVIMVNWAVPRSLAATGGISVDFCSSGYLDVSVPRVCFNAPMYSVRNDRKRPGFPIRKSPDQSQFAGSPRLIACYNVLHRLLPPRHPPCALDYLNHVTRNIPVTGKIGAWEINHANAVPTSSTLQARSFPLGAGSAFNCNGTILFVKVRRGDKATRMNLVELIGFEPTTFCLQSRRSPG